MEPFDSLTHTLMMCPLHPELLGSPFNYLGEGALQRSVYNFFQGVPDQKFSPTMAVFEPTLGRAKWILCFALPGRSET